MTRKRKRIVIEIMVSMPDDVSARDARREIRTRIKNQCGWSDETDDVKLVSLKPIDRRAGN